MNFKKVFRAGIRYLTDKDYRLLWHLDLFRYRKMDDKRYLEIRYKAIFKKDINFNPPVTFNEKMQWLKLYDRRPEYTMMVDKYEVKKYVFDVSFSFPNNK